jgi:hypothetical protein
LDNHLGLAKSCDIKVQVQERSYALDSPMALFWDEGRVLDASWIYDPLHLDRDKR